MGVFKQEEQTRELLAQGGLAREVLLGQIMKAELFARREFIGQIHVHLKRCFFAQGHEFRRGGFLKAQEHLGQFHFDAFARLQFNLCVGVGLR